jgi:molybdopterin-guanine dinucleotide biosynthesis protein A
MPLSGLNWNIAGLILAGGRATRMGGEDKALLRLGGRPLVRHAIERLRPQVAILALNANGDPSRFACTGLPVIPDRVPGFAGPLAGLLAGLEWAAERGADAVVTVAVDTPFFPSDLVARLNAAAEAEGATAAVAATRGPKGVELHPTFGLWPVASRAALAEALAGGTRRVRDWSEACGAASVVFGDAGEPFFNVNTPDDLVRARALPTVIE